MHVRSGTCHSRLVGLHGKFGPMRPCPAQLRAWTLARTLPRLYRFISLQSHGAVDEDDEFFADQRLGWVGGTGRAHHVRPSFSRGTRGRAPRPFPAAS